MASHLMRRLLLPEASYKLLAAVVAEHAHEASEKALDERLATSWQALATMVQAAPYVVEGARHLLPLDDIELNILGAMVSHRLCQLLDSGIDGPHLQRLHEQICLLAKLLPLLHVCKRCHLGSTEFNPVGTGCSVPQNPDNLSGYHEWEPAPGLHDAYQSINHSLYLCMNCDWHGTTEEDAVNHMRNPGA